MTRSFDEEEKQKRFGKVSDRLPRRQRQVRVVSCEIEIPNELYETITLTFLEYCPISIEEFINNRFMELMKQILSDPSEFGKLMLDNVRALHNLQNVKGIGEVKEKEEVESQ